MWCNSKKNHNGEQKRHEGSPLHIPVEKRTWKPELNTGHFIMFCMITNIYNKKTKGPTFIELFTATGKLKKFFLTTRDVRCVRHGWHGTHRYDTQVPATRLNMGASIFFTAAVIRAFRSARSRGNGGTSTVRHTIATWGKNLNIVSMCAVSPVAHTSNISSCQKKLFHFSCGCEQFH
jgi:hypothetical protein